MSGQRELDRSLVPESTIRRLPLYLRCLLEAREKFMPLVSSVDLAGSSGTNAAQVRKDLSYLGELGTRGIGYEVDGLISYISRWLGIVEKRRGAIVGAGRLGSALVCYRGFDERGMTVVAAFDDDPAKQGEAPFDGVPVYPMDGFEDRLRELDVDIVIVATPASAAQKVVDRAASAGVRAILNFASVNVDVPEGVAVRHVDLSVELQILSFHLQKGTKRG